MQRARVDHLSGVGCQGPYVADPPITQRRGKNSGRFNADTMGDRLVPPPLQKYSPSTADSTTSIRAAGMIATDKVSDHFASTALLGELAYVSFFLPRITPTRSAAKRSTRLHPPGTRGVCLL
jgi:hypothetical protein